MAQYETDIPRRVPAVQTGTRVSPWNSAILSGALLCVALIAGTYLRIYQLNIHGYNTDEAVYAGQAAAIAGVPVLKDLFPIFRAHPLLFQFVLSLLFKIGFNDLWGRLIAVVVGMGTVLVTYGAARRLYGNLAGALAGLMMAFMPYHVIVSRQVLLDGPMTFFATMTLYMLTRFGVSQGRSVWLFATGAAMGLTVLSKETGIVLLGAIYAFLALANEIRVKILDLIIATAIMVIVIAPFPISMMLAGGSNTGRQYLIWQLFRRSNHEWFFYPTTVTPAVGYLVVACAILGLILLWKNGSWQVKLLLSWIIVPVAFFQLWPTKGFQYLLPTAPAITILAARFLVKWAPGAIQVFKRTLALGWVNGALAAVTILSLASSSWQIVQPSTSSSFLAGTGGVPGGREAGAWILSNVPNGSTMLAIGPSMANILEFYGHRKAYGLSVSPNPLFRNPSYTPINNPDLLFRKAEIQYIVWDSFSADRTPFFASKLLEFVQKYNGRVAHIESVLLPGPDGKPVAKPIIIIYEVRP